MVALLNGAISLAEQAVAGGATHTHTLTHSHTHTHTHTHTHNHTPATGSIRYARRADCLAGWPIIIAFRRRRRRRGQHGEPWPEIDPASRLIFFFRFADAADAARLGRTATADGVTKEVARSSFAGLVFRIPTPPCANEPSIHLAVRTRSRWCRRIFARRNNADTLEWPYSCLLLGFIEFGSLCKAFTGFYRVLPGFTGFYWVFSGFYWVLLGFTGFYWV